MKLFSLFGDKSPPNIEQLKAKKNVNGLIKALKWRQHDINGSAESGIDESDRRKAALAVAEISGVKAIDSLIEVIRETEHKKHILDQLDITDQHSKVFKELTSISRAAKEALPIIGQPVVDRILKFLRKWKLDFIDINRYQYWDTIKKSLLEVLTDIGDEEAVLKNLLKAKDTVLSETFSEVFIKRFPQVSGSDERLMKQKKKVAPEKSSEKKDGAAVGLSDEIAKSLSDIRTKFTQLPHSFPATGESVGSGAEVAKQQIPIICANIEQALKALESGLDPNSNPITGELVGEGLTQLVNAAQRSEFLGLMSGVLSIEGVTQMEGYLNELKSLAGQLRQLAQQSPADEQRLDPPKSSDVVCLKNMRGRIMERDKTLFQIKVHEHFSKKTKKGAASTGVFIIFISVVVGIAGTLVRQAKLGASCRVKVPVGQGLANHPY